MSNESEWTEAHDFGLERIRSFIEPLSPAVASPSESHLQDFASVIENIIVPRLLMNHVHNVRKPEMKKAQLGAQGVRDFIELTMLDEPDAAVNFVERLLSDGVLFQDVLLNLMAPAARELGERWVHDSASFVEVTLGVARMHRILREFDGVPDHLWSQNGAGRHALLLPTPGEQHTFGLRLVQEFLLRESWTISNRPVERHSELSRVVNEQHFDVIGLSLSGETLFDSLRSAIQGIRNHSRNKRVKIIVGGQIFVERPELLDKLEADAFALDATSAVRIVNAWAAEKASAH